MVSKEIIILTILILDKLNDPRGSRESKSLKDGEEDVIIKDLVEYDINNPLGTPESQKIKNLRNSLGVSYNQLDLKLDNVNDAEHPQEEKVLKGENLKEDVEIINHSKLDEDHNQDQRRKQNKYTNNEVKISSDEMDEIEVKNIIEGKSEKSQNTDEKEAEVKLLKNNLTPNRELNIMNNFVSEINNAQMVVDGII